MLWRHGVVVITTAQLHSTKPELRFCAGSNPARGVSEIRDGEDLWQWSRLEIKLNAFRWSTIPQNKSSSSSSKKCGKAFNTLSSTVQFIPECYKAQEMYDKVFNKSILAFIYIPDQYKTQEMRDSIISEDPFSIRYIPYQYKTQQLNKCVMKLLMIF